MSVEKFKKTTDYKVGYAFVVGDLFHVGHLRHLQKCRELCDYLIVGVYTTELAETYKNKPIIPTNERIEIVEALNCVDETRKVRVKDGRNPIPVLERLIADGYNIQILFGSKDHTAVKKGPNYSKDYLFNAEKTRKEWMKVYRKVRKYMKKRGGRVMQLPYHKNRTTTLIRESIFKAQLPYMDDYMKNLKKKAS